MIAMKITGLKESEAFLEKLQANLKKLNNIKVFVGSNLTYAYGIEYGVTRRGKMARRAGGAFMITNAVKETQDDLKHDIINAIQTNGDIAAALLRAGMRAENLAKSQTPVMTGSLRRSIHTIVG